MSSMDTVALTVMRAICPKDELADKLQVVGRGVSARTTVQILAGIMLRAAGGRLHLSATDMELSIRDSLEAEVDEDGAVVVPGRLLVDIVRLLPGGDVTLEHRADEGVARLTCGSASYQLNTYGPEDFPRLPEIEPDAAFTVERPAFLDTVGRVGRSASRDESRPVLTGVLVRFEGDKLVMAATDSYRLSVKETMLTTSPGKELEAIVPARALQELVRIGQAAKSDTIEVGVQENQVVFGVDGVWLTARRIDGQFPNYRQLLPEQFEAEVSLPRDELLDVVRRTGLLAQRKSPLRLRFEEGGLTVSAQTQDVGEARESLPVSYTGEPIEIGFNADFLRDGLESVTEDTVRLKLISPLRPGLIHGESDDFLYLIMPIRLAG
jgi:DNA polymerase III subunit beta